MLKAELKKTSEEGLRPMSEALMRHCDCQTGVVVGPTQVGKVPQQVEWLSF